MNTLNFGFTISVDLHRMSAAEARGELNKVIKGCSKDVSEIEVIHGCHNGKVLLDMVRKQFKHPRVERKILTMNPGITIFVLKKQ